MVSDRDGRIEVLRLQIVALNESLAMERKKGIEIASSLEQVEDSWRSARISNGEDAIAWKVKADYWQSKAHATIKERDEQRMRLVLLQKGIEDLVTPKSQSVSIPDNLIPSTVDSPYHQCAT